MASKLMYEDSSRVASAEKLLAQDADSMRAETVSLSGSERQDEEAIAGIRRGRKSARYVKLLWSITLYALAIWGVYSLTIRAVPMMHHTHGRKHVTLGEADAEHHHEQKVEKVPFGHAPSEQAQIESEHHHEHHLQGKPQENSAHGNSDKEHHDDHGQNGHASHDEPKIESEHHHHEFHNDKEQTEHTPVETVEWTEPERNHGHKEEEKNEPAGHQTYEPEQHHEHHAKRSTTSATTLNRERSSASSTLSERRAEYIGRRRRISSSVV